ncbi:hypothetical protein D9758_012898 [Tetrapyrgos nigripes]|uniref:Uncharacterized protein n=1 Tax=Tetrapyrgos nigripes TaxID=182062 RepID=A0A8H5CNB1_9AGAR|nr:hypothetical protein D9758_012898 [Tetrapyrgos nigripes]
MGDNHSLSRPSKRIPLIEGQRTRTSSSVKTNDTLKETRDQRAVARNHAVAGTSTLQSTSKFNSSPKSSPSPICTASQASRKSTTAWTKKVSKATKSFLLGLPDELLLLIAEQTVQHGVVTIRVPSERLKSKRSELAKRQPSIYHLSMACHRLRNVCNEFLFRRIQFSFLEDVTVTPTMITELSQKFHCRADAASTIKRVSFTSTSHAQPRPSSDLLRSFLVLVLDIIHMCTQLKRVFLPDICSRNQSQDTMKLLEAVNNHPSSELLLVYTKIYGFQPFRNPGSLLTVPLSRLLLLSLNACDHHSHTPRYLEPLLKQGLRVQKLERNLHNRESLEWFGWTRLTYPGLKVVSGWLLFQSIEIQEFIRRHPLLEKIEVILEHEEPGKLSSCWLTAIPGVSKLFANFPFRKASHRSELLSVTIVRRDVVWKLEEVYVSYHCDWREEDLVPMANNLKAILPNQIRRVSLTSPCIRSEGYISSLLTKRGLNVKWRSYY